MSYQFKKRKRIHIKKTAEETAILQALRSFLDINEPKLVRFLVHNFRSQGRTITYKELREAILKGFLTKDMLEEWQQDYSKFVAEHLQPMWIAAMKESVKQLQEKYPGWAFDPHAEGVREWTEARAASFVTEVTTTQIEGLRAVVFKASVLEEMSVDQLSRVIRPMVGLNRPQAIANLNYYTHLLSTGVSEERALDLSIRYAARQHRYRGYMIARTELAFAYNQGAYIGTKQAQERGYMGECVKIWSTALDERVCPVCGGLEGKRIALDDDFPFQTKLTEPGIRRTPPAHPNCRCSYLIKEIAPPASFASFTQLGPEKTTAGGPQYDIHED